MGATNPILNEELFWFGDDDGIDETDNTFLGIKNSNQSLDVDTNYRYRTSVSNTGDKASNNTQLQLEYNYEGGGWNAVNASSSVIRIVASTKLIEGNNCTERLAGAQSFESANGGQEDGDGLTGTQVDLGIANEFEADFCFTIISGDVVDAETIVLRVTDSGSPLDNYNQTPIITVAESGAIYNEALTLTRGQNTVILTNLIVTSDDIVLGKDLASSFVAGLLYNNAITLAIINKTVTSTGFLTRIGALSLGKSIDISFVSQLDAVGVMAFGKNLGISIAGNIISPQTITLGSKDLGLTLDGNIITLQSLSLGKDKGVSFVGGLAFATALSLAKNIGIIESSSLTRIGTLSLNKDAGIAIVNFLTRAGALSFNKIHTIVLNGTLISPQSLSLTRDLGIAQSAQTDFFAAISIAKFVAFIPTHEFISGSAPGIPTYTGNIELIEDVTGILEIIEQASGNIVLIETPTGTLILDLTP